mmetsp:Transcript_53000/g.140930  ORF Transcript_53000/g.140930 Transcript_53000/m.140930 type:complete len:170 (-) Transcript_53000:64-573(-)
MLQPVMAQAPACAAVLQARPALSASLTLILLEAVLRLVVLDAWGGVQYGLVWLMGCLAYRCELLYILWFALITSFTLAFDFAFLMAHGWSSGAAVLSLQVPLAANLPAAALALGPVASFAGTVVGWWMFRAFVLDEAFHSPAAAPGPQQTPAQAAGAGPWAGKAHRLQG